MCKTDSFSWFQPGSVMISQGKGASKSRAFYLRSRFELHGARTPLIIGHLRARGLATY